MLDWVQSNPGLVWTLGVLSVLTFVGSLIAIPVLILRMPADFFLPKEERATSYSDVHPVIAFLVKSTKNVLGAVLVLAGIAMLVLPGQGVITILIGLSVMSFPGKRKLELRIVRTGPVLKTINWMRRKRGKEPLTLPEKKKKRKKGHPPTKN